MKRLRLKKNTLNNKCALEYRVFQTETRANFLERIVRALRGFTVTIYHYSASDRKFTQKKE